MSKDIDKLKKDALKFLTDNPVTIPDTYADVVLEELSLRVLNSRKPCYWDDKDIGDWSGFVNIVDSVAKKFYKNRS